ncbi:unc-45 B-like [Homarus americanus]|uniref:Protein unc-45 homolog B n=1 Tax=Homarus americanus TaxID=6706 RepID=A0A8J5KD49_HOMAM|nr:unc-45 B-like [Homarus americanus]
MTKGEGDKTPQQLKEEGNEAYKLADWDKAIDKYSQALTATTEDKERSVFYKNRAAVYLKIEDYENVALFRRAQAYEALEQAEKAYADARTLQVVDPKNKEVQEMLSRVHKVVQDLVEEKTKTSGKVQQLFDILFDPGCEKDKRETCANNLVALARERAGSELLMKQNILGRMVQMLKTEKNFEIKIACARTLSEFCKDLDRTKLILQEIGIPWLLDLMNNKHEGLVNATQYTFQKIFNTLSGMDINLMATLVSIVTQRTMSGLCRDAVIELILKNVDWEKLNWADKFIRMGGIEKMLDICSELEEFQFESRIDITDNTRMTTAICLAKVYDSQYDDKAREAYRNRVDEYIREGILEMLLVMANSDDLLQQKAACEALIAAATKKDKCRSIITQGTDILKKLYQSKNDAIKVRALVGLFLVNPTKDKDMRRWACEGLSYLTLDADVKEKLISDRPALRSMIELAKSGDMNCLYGVVATFVNLCNAYDTQEVIPEMVELAKFAKQHVPETHDLDDQDFVDKRVTILAEEGAATALTALSKTDSCLMPYDNRGLVVQQGGTKALLDLATEGTKKGKTVAAQALARIAITINPEVAFPGQRAYEVVRPLLKLLDPECQALENFESLMGLTNIAGISESTRKRIIKERGLPLIENYMFEHHEMIRRAAIQCMANMCASPDIIKLLEGKNDKFKYLFLCASDEDEEIIKAAAGALCMVMSESPKCLVKVFEAKDWEEILEFLLSHANKDIQYRGTVIVFLLVSHDKQTAERIIDTHCKTALEAISKIDNPEFVLPKAREYAHNTLKLCATQWKLIKDPDAVD